MKTNSNSPLTCHVISLKSEIKRREHITRVFGSHNVSFEFFDAITKGEVDDYIATNRLKIKPGSLSPAELACFFSHLSLWQMMLTENIEIMAIFEDDVYLGDDIGGLMQSADWIPTPFDVIRLETIMQNGYFKKYGKIAGTERELCLLRSQQMGMAGYILHLSAAKKLVTAMHKMQLDRPVDHYLFDWFVNSFKNRIFQVDPAICIQDKILRPEDNELGSALEDGRKALENAPKQKLPVSQKIKREVRRVIHQLHPKRAIRSLSITLQCGNSRTIPYR